MRAGENAQQYSKGNIQESNSENIPVSDAVLPKKTNVNGFSEIIENDKIIDQTNGKNS